MLAQESSDPQVAELTRRGRAMHRTLGEGGVRAVRRPPRPPHRPAGRGDRRLHVEVAAPRPPLLPGTDRTAHPSHGRRRSSKAPGSKENHHEQRSLRHVGRRRQRPSRPRHRRRAAAARPPGPGDGAPGPARAGRRAWGSTSRRSTRPDPSRRPTPARPSTTWRVFGDRAMGRDVVEELRREPAALVVVDCILFGAMEAVAAEGVPYVVLEHMYDAYLVRRWLRGPMGLGMAVKRIPARRLLTACGRAAGRLRPGARSRGQRPATGQSPLHRSRGGWCPGGARRADRAGQSQHGQLPRPGAGDAAHPGRARHTRRAGDRHGGARHRHRTTWRLRRTSSSAGSSRTPSCCRRCRW